MRRCLWCVLACVALGCNSTPDASTPEPEPEAPELNAKPLPRLTEAELARLARTDPIAFLKHCQDRTAREIHSYRGTLLMHERLEGKVGAPQRIAFWFRERPFSVRMDWKEGMKLARKTLYVPSANDGDLLVQPAGWRSWVGIVRRRPDSEDATGSSRIPITRFGMQLGIASTLRAWEAARQRHELHVTFDGPRTVNELGDLPVFELKRTGYATPEDDGIVKSTYYYDPRTGLQVGTVLRGEGGRLIGSYYFRDLELNAEFPADTFTRAGLKKD